MFEWLLARCLDGFVPDLPAPTVASESQAETCCCRLLGGLSSELLGEVLQSTLGPVGRLGSKLFGGNFAKYPGATGRAFDSKLFGGNFATYPGASGGLGSELFGGKFW